MANYRFNVPKDVRRVFTAVGLLDGERFLLRRVVYDDTCGQEVGVVDFRPNCCLIYLGVCDGSTQANTGNPIMLDTTHAGGDIAGTYEFVPDGVFANPDAVHIYVDSY